MLKFNFFQLDVLINQGCACHHCYVLQIFLFNASRPWDIDSAALDNILLIVVNHGAHWLLLQIFTKEKKWSLRLFHFFENGGYLGNFLDFVSDDQY